MFNKYQRDLQKCQTVFFSFTPERTNKIFWSVHEMLFPSKGSSTGGLFGGMLLRKQGNDRWCGYV